MVLSYGDTVYATVPLVALNSVEASRSMMLLYQIRQFFARPLVGILCFLLLAVLAALAVWKLTVGRRRYRYGKTVRKSRGYRGRKKPF